MWTVLILLILVYFITKETKKSTTQVKIGEYKTNYFDKRSQETFEELKQEGVSQKSLLDFALMEDQFLGYEKETVCLGKNRKLEAMILSQQIKDRFSGYDFSYHTLHIKHMAEPHKMINKNLVCL